MKCLVNVPLKRLLTILTAVLFLLLSPRAMAQTMTVEGVVYDKDHAVIPGVSVMIRTIRITSLLPDLTERIP